MSVDVRGRGAQLTSPSSWRHGVIEKPSYAVLIHVKQVLGHHVTGNEVELLPRMVCASIHSSPSQGGTLRNSVSVLELWTGD